MSFQKILRDQVVQTVDLLEIFLCLMVPVILTKGAIDFLSQGQLFWLSYAILFLKSVGGFIGLFAVIDLFEAVRRYRSR
ncbi:hypothetical protein [Levilactobacillus tujiorum]|uniref:hypothetical protein n=1 Tax=Levilactobacillus tujiorum TaxID=2912243 RepID=UPI0014569910|nr:hypothetical protein [Levilactobacillus tujiorum]NLR30917.1 hypothetical protein [Levilactobacillus tujiorum]